MKKSSEDNGFMATLIMILYVRGLEKKNAYDSSELLFTFHRIRISHNSKQDSFWCGYFVASEPVFPREVHGNVLDNLWG